MPETMLLQIRGVHDTEPCRVVELHGLSVRIGRGPQCEVRLTSAELAPVQCLLRRRGPAWHLHPVGPKNFVWLEGSILSTQRALDPGAEFSVGAFRLTLLPVVTTTNEWDSRTAPPTPEVERDDPRSRWAKSRLEERRWEARWRAVGEQVKVRAATPPAPVTVSRSLARIATPVPTPAAVPQQLPAIRRTLGLATAFMVEQPLPPLDRDAFDEELAEAVSTLFDVEVIEPTPDSVEVVFAIDEVQGHPELPVLEVVAVATALDEAEAEAEAIVADEVMFEAPPACEVAAATEPVLITFQAVTVEPAPQVEAPPRVVAPLPSRVIEPEPSVVDPGWSDRTTTESRNIPARPIMAPIEPIRARGLSEWPSSKLVMMRLDALALENNSTSVRTNSADRTLTVEVEPRHWKLPRWVAGPVILLATTGFASLGLFLSWQWMIDDLAAGKVVDHLLQHVPKQTLEADVAELPEPLWWRTRASSTYARAVAIEQATDDPTQARPWLIASHAITPVSAPTRLAQAKLHSDTGELPPLATSTGLSRDVMSMTWTGHRLADAGKFEAALAAYRTALDLATLEEIERLPALTFHDDDQVRRYLLPYENLIGPILRDMADRPGWTSAEWSRAVPDVAVAKLALARVLGDRKDPTETEALAQALEPTREPVPAAAIDTAVRAEVFALQRNFIDAEPAYRAAIEQLADPKIKRSWWMNLAEIHRKLEDPKSRRDSLESAKCLLPHDEITRRAVDYQELDGRPIERQTAYSTTKDSK